MSEQTPKKQENPTLELSKRFDEVLNSKIKVKEEDIGYISSDDYYKYTDKNVVKAFDFVDQTVGFNKNYIPPKLEEGEVEVPFGYSASEDVTKDFSHLVYVNTDFPNPVILCGSSAYEATSRVFDSDVDVIEFLDDSHLLVHGILKSKLSDKYLVRYFDG